MTPELLLDVFKHVATQWRIPRSRRYPDTEEKNQEQVDGVAALALCTRMVEALTVKAWSAPQREALLKLLQDQLLGYSGPRQASEQADALRQALLKKGLVNTASLVEWREQFSRAMESSPSTVRHLLDHVPLRSNKTPYSVNELLVGARSPMGGGMLEWKNQWPTLAEYVVHKSHFWQRKDKGESLIDLLREHGFDLMAQLSDHRPLMGAAVDAEILDQAMNLGIRPWRVEAEHRATVLQHGLWQWSRHGLSRLPASVMEALTEDLAEWSVAERQTAVQFLLHLALRHREEPADAVGEAKLLAQQLTKLVGGVAHIPLASHEGHAWSIDGRKAYEWLMSQMHRVDWDPKVTREKSLQCLPQEWLSLKQLHHISIEGIPDGIWALLAQSVHPKASRGAHPAYGWYAEASDPKALDDALHRAYTHVLRGLEGGPILVEEALAIWNTWANDPQPRFNRMADRVFPELAETLVQAPMLWRKLDVEPQVCQQWYDALAQHGAEQPRWALLGWVLGLGEAKPKEAPARAAQQQQQLALRQAWEHAVSQGWRVGEDTPDLLTLWQTRAPKAHAWYEAQVLAQALEGVVSVPARRPRL